MGARTTLASSLLFGTHPRRLRIATVLIALGGLAAGSAADDIADLRAALGERRDAFTAVRSRVRTVRVWTDDYYRLTGTSRSIPARSVVESEWIADRHRVMDAGSSAFWSLSERGAAPHPYRYARLFDGRTSTSVEDTSPKVPQTITRSARRKGFANPLEYGYTYQGRWFADVLARKGARVTGTEDDARYGPLIVAEAPTETASRLVIRFAKRCGNLAVRVERGAAQPRNGAQSDLTVWTLDEARQVGGLWLPISGAREWSTQGAGRTTLIERISYRLESPEVGGDYGALLRLPRFTPGSLVKDVDQGLFYRVRPDGSLRPIGRVGAKATLQPREGLTVLGWICFASLAGALALSGGLIRHSIRHRSAPVSRDLPTAHRGA